MPLSFTQHNLYRITLQARRKRSENASVSLHRDIPLVGQSTPLNGASGPVTGKELDDIIASLNKYFVDILPASLKIERDDFFHAFRPSISEHFVCVTTNGFFFMASDGITIGSPRDIFGNESQSVAQEITQGVLEIKEKMRCMR